MGQAFDPDGQATLTTAVESFPQDGTDFDFLASGPGFTVTPPPEELGCFNNPTSSPVLTGFFFTSQMMTNQLCHTTCGNMGYLYAGTQDSDSCYCGSTPYQILGRSSCSMTCLGNPFEICGDEEAFTAWSTGILAVPAPAAFTLDDEPIQSDTTDQSITFTDLPGGEYTISLENLPPGWRVDAVDCGDADHVRNGNGVTVAFVDAASVNCLFSIRCVWDSDHDDDVDVADYGDAESCLSGPAFAADVGCDCHDNDVDGDVDIVDIAALGRAFTGS